LRYRTSNCYMLKKIRNKILGGSRFINILIKVKKQNDKFEILVENTMLQNGKVLTESILQKKDISSIHDVEFKVFSQWGDDGIIQYLINYLEISNKIFIEFGVADYLESNTRYLLMNNNWTGLVMDGSSINVDKIKKSDFYWKYDLTAKATFITSENINLLIKDAGFKGEIGLLHIDIDGNDYWIWEALDIVKPIVMIVEYNSVFGSDRSITVPYKADFSRTDAHFSNLYAGASIAALCDLAKEKGYAFIGSNSAGNNAYFVKKNYLKDLKPLSAEDGYVESKFRESRNKEGKLTYLSGNERLDELKGLDVFNTRTNKIEKL